MPSWVIISQTVTAGGDPAQFHVDAIHEHEREVFLIAALRITGPDDNEMPRRLVGLGDTRARARVALDDAFTRYDSSYRLVPSR